MRFTLRKIKSETNLLLRRNKSKPDLHEADVNFPAVPELPPKLPMPECLITRISLMEIDAPSTGSSPISPHVTTLSLGGVRPGSSELSAQRSWQQVKPSNTARPPATGSAPMPSELYRNELQLAIEKEMAKRAMAAWKFPKSPSRHSALDRVAGKVPPHAKQDHPSQPSPGTRFPQRHEHAQLYGPHERAPGVLRVLSPCKGSLGSCEEPSSKRRGPLGPTPGTGPQPQPTRAQWSGSHRQAPAPPRSNEAWPAPTPYEGSPASKSTTSRSTLARREALPPALGCTTNQPRTAYRGPSLREAHNARQAVYPRSASAKRNGPVDQYASQTGRTPASPLAPPARPWSPFRNPRPPPRPPQEPPAAGPAPVQPVPAREAKEPATAAASAAPSSTSSKWKFGLWGKSKSSERAEPVKCHVRRSSSFYVPETDLDHFPIPPERMAQPDLPPWKPYVLGPLPQIRQQQQPLAASVMLGEEPFFHEPISGQQTLPVEYESLSPVIAPGSIDFSAPQPGYNSDRQSQRGLSTPPLRRRDPVFPVMWAGPSESPTPPPDVSHVPPVLCPVTGVLVHPTLHVERDWIPPAHDIGRYPTPAPVQSRRRSHTVTAIQPGAGRRTRQPHHWTSRWPPS